MTDQDGSVMTAENVIRHSPIDWDFLLEAARIHSIRPQVEHLLKSIPHGIVPGQVLAKLADVNRENALRQLRSLSAFFEIHELLKESGIRVIPFKGSWLAEHYYGDISGRESYDLDLFIDFRDLDAIKHLMNEFGYVNNSIINSLKDDYVKDQLCEFNFDKFEKETCIQHIEFHWSSSMGLFRMNIRMDELQSQIIHSRLQGKDISVFSAAADMLLTVMHHGGKEQYAFIKQVNDIAHFILKENEIDWLWLLEKCRKYHLETVLHIGVRQANLVTGINIPEIINKKASSRKISRVARRRIRMLSYPVSKRESFGYIFRGWLFHIRSRDGMKLKTWLAWQAFRKVLLPAVVPKRIHYLFFNKKIRKGS